MMVEAPFITEFSVVFFVQRGATDFQGTLLLIAEVIHSGPLPSTTVLWGMPWKKNANHWLTINHQFTIINHYWLAVDLPL
jgi:hypothetical protein